MLWLRAGGGLEATTSAVATCSEMQIKESHTYSQMVYTVYMNSEILYVTKNKYLDWHKWCVNRKILHVTKNKFLD